MWPSVVSTRAESGALCKRRFFVLVWKGKIVDVLAEDTHVVVGKRSIVYALKVRAHRVVHTSKIARERKRIVNDAGIFDVYSISESQLYGA